MIYKRIFIDSNYQQTIPQHPLPQTIPIPGVTVSSNVVTSSSKISFTLPHSHLIPLHHCLISFFIPPNFYFFISVINLQT